MFKRKNVIYVLFQNHTTTKRGLVAGPSLENLERIAGKLSLCFFWKSPTDIPRATVYLLKQFTGKEIRENRVSGAVEAFSRRHPTTSTPRDRSASRNSDDGPLSKHAVKNLCPSSGFSDQFFFGAQFRFG